MSMNSTGDDVELRRACMKTLMQAAKSAGLWALGAPGDIGGQGMPFMEYVLVNEVIGRSQHAMQALGTLSLQDSLMLRRHATPEWQEAYLKPIVAGEFVPSFAMTEPDVASSDPTQLKTSAVLEGDEWRINGGSGSRLVRRRRVTPRSCAGARSNRGRTTPSA
jgi:acyl-CoA dehydrogenase